MKASSLWRLLTAIVVIIIIIGGVILIVIGRPIPPEPECLTCGLRGVIIGGIAEIILGIISLGVINRIRNVSKIN